MKQEEDIEGNLTGDQEKSDMEAKTSWFKRIKKGILTSTSDKKAYGQNARYVNTPVW